MNSPQVQEMFQIHCAMMGDKKGNMNQGVGGREDWRGIKELWE